MDISQFYTFSSKLSSSTIQVHAQGLSSNKDIDGRYDEHRLIQGVYEGIAFPVAFKQEYGKKLEDMLDTGWPGLFLISYRMKIILEQNELTGWKTFTVKVLDKRGHEIENYHGLSILGRCGPVDYSKSEIIEKRIVPQGPLGKYYKGFPVGLDKWDESDFFLPDKNFGTIVTQKVMELFKKNKITNTIFRNLAEIEISVFDVR